MKQTWNSFLQTVFQFVKSLSLKVSKKIHRDAVVLTAGISVVTLVTLMAGDFQGVRGNAMVAFAETQEGTGREAADLEETDGNASAAEEKIEEESEDTGEKETDPEVTEKAGAEDGESEGTGESEDGGRNGEIEDSIENRESESRAESRDGEDSAEQGEIEDSAESRENENRAENREEENNAKNGEGEDRAEEDEETPGIIALSDKDYQVLLKIVQAEAGGCDEKGRVLVANVILNRVESEEFPDTVSGVVYERHQFSPVGDGSLNRCKVTDETVNAVALALSGVDYSEGALYFMNRGQSSGKNVRWFDNHLEYLFKYGSHEFFK